MRRKMKTKMRMVLMMKFILAQCFLIYETLKTSTHNSLQSKETHENVRLYNVSFSIIQGHFLIAKIF